VAQISGMLSLLIFCVLAGVGWVALIAFAIR
jgi:hypothetical protein